jgi:phage tail sheath protein FI
LGNAIDIQGNLPYQGVPVSLKATADTPKLCTSFSEFKQFLYGDQLNQIDSQRNPVSLSGFPDPTGDPSLSYLIHAVYGFFSNGGTRCYVLLLSGSSVSDQSLEPLNAIEEISIVVVPGMDKNRQDAIISYCATGANQGNFYRFAVLDCQASDSQPAATLNAIQVPGNSDYAAFYYPWIKVADPASQIMQINDGLLAVPPSGHIAGVYARVDNLRGVHKAPANEVIFGALGVTRSISKNQQAGLNPQGTNCIRDLNGNIRIWGARTLGGQANGEFTYISTRRLFLYLRQSIDQATQWTVFEPNNPELWAKIRRNVTAFLTNTWRTGALFGTTPQEAFYVKCDAENNPPEVRDLGQVVIEIGVAVTKPAEFVIFRISQWAGPTA